MRHDNWDELFPRQKISKSEECKMYRYRKYAGIVGTPGRPRSANPSKDALRLREKRAKVAA